MPQDNDLAFPDFRSILDLPTPFGKAPGEVAEDRFTGRVIVDGEPIEVEAGEALFNGQIFKVGKADDKGNRQVFDAKQNVVGTVGQEGDQSVFRAPTIKDFNQSLFSVGDGRNFGTSNVAVGRDGKPTGFQAQGINNRGGGRPGATPQLDNLQSLLAGDKSFDAEALIGGSKKEVRDELKREAIKKIFSFFK